MITIELPGRREFVVKEIRGFTNEMGVVSPAPLTLPRQGGAVDLCRYAKPSTPNTCIIGYVNIEHKQIYIQTPRKLYASDEVRKKVTQDASYLCVLTADAGTIFTCPFSGKDGIKRNKKDHSIVMGRYGAVPDNRPCPLAVLCVNHPLHVMDHDSSSIADNRRILQQSVRLHL